jgi:hypothetical protein
MHTAFAGTNAIAVTTKALSFRLRLAPGLSPSA